MNQNELIQIVARRVPITDLARFYEIFEGRENWSVADWPEEFRVLATGEAR